MNEPQDLMNTQNFIKSIHFFSFRFSLNFVSYVMFVSITHDFIVFFVKNLVLIFFGGGGG